MAHVMYSGDSDDVMPLQLLNSMFSEYYLAGWNIVSSAFSKNALHVDFKFQTLRVSPVHIGPSAAFCVQILQKLYNHLHLRRWTVVSNKHSPGVIHFSFTFEFYSSTAMHPPLDFPQYHNDPLLNDTMEQPYAIADNMTAVMHMFDELNLLGSHRRSKSENPELHYGQSDSKATATDHKRIRKAKTRGTYQHYPSSSGNETPAYENEEKRPIYDHMLQGNASTYGQNDLSPSKYDLPGDISNELFDSLYVNSDSDNKREKLFGRSLPRKKDNGYQHNRKSRSRTTADVTLPRSKSEKERKNGIGEPSHAHLNNLFNRLYLKETESNQTSDASHKKRSPQSKPAKKDQSKKNLIKESQKELSSASELDSDADEDEQDEEEPSEQTAEAVPQLISVRKVDEPEALKDNVSKKRAKSLVNPKVRHISTKPRLSAGMATTIRAKEPEPLEILPYHVKLNSDGGSGISSGHKANSSVASSHSRNVTSAHFPDHINATGAASHSHSIDGSYSKSHNSTNISVVEVHSVEAEPVQLKKKSVKHGKKAEKLLKTLGFGRKSRSKSMQNINVQRLFDSTDVEAMRQNGTSSGAGVGAPVGTDVSAHLSTRNGIGTMVAAGSSSISTEGNRTSTISTDVPSKVAETFFEDKDRIHARVQSSYEKVQLLCTMCQRAKLDARDVFRPCPACFNVYCADCHWWCVMARKGRCVHCYYDAASTLSTFTTSATEPPLPDA